MTQEKKRVCVCVCLYTYVNTILQTSDAKNQTVNMFELHTSQLLISYAPSQAYHRDTACVRDYA